MRAGNGRLSRLLLFAMASGFWLEPSAVAQTPAETGAADSLAQTLEIFTEVLALVDRAYVTETEVRTLLDSSIDGIADALDPFALYVPPAEVEAYLEARSGARDRSGLLVLKERGVAYVVAVDDGSPAARAGIESGDILKTLDGSRTRPMPIWKIRQLLARPPGSRLTLELIEAGVERTVELELAALEPPKMTMRLVRGVPVLRIASFSDRTAAELDQMLDADQDRLVIDLRGVAGGEPEAAYAVAERFADGELGALAGRHGVLKSFENPVPPIWSGKLVVLVNRGTQGPAEILATVLRQACGAELVGGHTFGHAGKIESIGLTSGARLELTNAFYTGPDLEPLAERLGPDLVVRPRLAAGDGEERPEIDDTLERALELLLEG